MNKIPANRPVTIYISAASDLMAEREALGRMIATLPVTLAWRIVQTPHRAEPLDLEAVRQADLYLLALGSDIRAPVGLEWHTAHRAGRPTLAFLKQGLARTLAGQAFVREVNLAWQPFSDAADLSRQVQSALVEHLLRHALHYALTPAEVEQLSALPTSETKPTSVTPGEEAAHSAVILSRERFMPSQGVIVDES
ncbi:MAG TPA: hypothetical protein VEC93_02420 [Anaerolineae bacterium]|nr:hypothetical protein [Anaerolineae bacterium]